MKQHKDIMSVLCLFFTLFFPIGAHAQSFEPLFERLCAEASVSKALAMAIAKHESGMNPWAVNVAGKGFMASSREEALMIIRSAHNAGKSYDVGLMQVNRWWIDSWGVAPESILEPEANIRAGLKILSGEIKRNGFSWKAVGAYHTPNPGRGRSYAWRIYHAAQAKSDKSKRSEAQDGQKKSRAQGILLPGGSGQGSGKRGPGRFVSF